MFSATVSAVSPFAICENLVPILDSRKRLTYLLDMGERIARSEKHMSKYMTTDQTAEYINTPLSTLRYWIVQDTAPKSFKLGKRRMFTVDDVDEWIADRIQASA
jgi:excisionase family DNA binding protein